MLSYDFSTLPKHRAYSYMGSLKNKLGACTWYTPWDCYMSGDIEAAKNELEQMHNVLLDIVNATNNFYQDAQQNGAPGSIVSALGQDVQLGHDLVQKHSQLMNTFYAETGSGGVSGLNGLSGRLGNPILLGFTALELGTMLFNAINSVAVFYLLNKLGDTMKAAVAAYNENQKTTQEKFKRDGQYYIDWKDAVSKGITPPPPPDDTGSIGTDWTTIALIGGSIALLFMLKK